ncbi:MAG TPA: lysophospholipid acyltransferase family protein [Polyangiaceae bacterium]
MRLFSMAYWAFIALACLPCFAIALVLYAVTLPFDRRRVVLHLFSCFWGALYLYANPIWRFRVVGRSKLPWKGPAVIVANHASLIDILVLFALYRPFKWVSKAQNFKIPFIGWNMTLNDYVPLVRGKRSSIIKMMAECRKHLGRGMPVLVFPEGTRTQDGELQEFKDGAFQLAAAVRCPVIPVAVHGTRNSLPKHGAVLRNGMDAFVEVLDPIAAEGRTAAELREAARDAIGAALAKGKGVAADVARRPAAA